MISNYGFLKSVLQKAAFILSYILKKKGKQIKKTTTEES